MVTGNPETLPWEAALRSEWSVGHETPGGTGLASATFHLQSANSGDKIRPTSDDGNAVSDAACINSVDIHGVMTGVWQFPAWNTMITQTK